MYHSFYYSIFNNDNDKELQCFLLYYQWGIKIYFHLSILATAYDEYDAGLTTDDEFYEFYEIMEFETNCLWAYQKDKNVETY